MIRITILYYAYFLPIYKLRVGLYIVCHIEPEATTKK